MKVWILFGILACIAWQANSAAVDDYQDGKNYIFLRLPT